MLVLTRKLMEKLYIGDNICVTVVRLEGGQVRLGIEAPRDVAVVRAELVPERQFGPHRGPIPGRTPSAPHAGTSPSEPSSPAPQGAGSVSPPNAGPNRGDVRIPQASAHGTGNRRRGPSR
jgi:carbon storage regulator